MLIETERLILRELIPDDLDGMYALDSDPEVHRYLGNSPVSDRNQLSGVIEFVRAQYRDHGIGRWAVIEKETNSFIGWSGLKYVREEVNGRRDFYDLGYRLLRSAWGRGYATESSIAALEFGFKTLQLTEIFAAVHTENQASNRVLQKLGFRVLETFLYDEESHYWCVLDKGAFSSTSK